MKQGALEPDINIALLNNEAEPYLALSIGEHCQPLLSLSMHDARQLARNLIQQVYLAEVKNSLRKSVFKPF